MATPRRVGQEEPPTRRAEVLPRAGCLAHRELRDNGHDDDDDAVMSSTPQRKYSSLTICWRLILQARPYWAHVAGFLFLSLLATPLALLAPLPLKVAVDCVI